MQPCDYIKAACFKYISETIFFDAERLHYSIVTLLMFQRIIVLVKVKININNGTNSS